MAKFHLATAKLSQNGYKTHLKTMKFDNTSYEMCQEQRQTKVEQKLYQGAQV